jgi:proteasome activator subunit 4
MKYLSGYIRGCPTTMIIKKISPVCFSLLSNPYDAVRRNASYLLSVVFTTHKMTMPLDTLGNGPSESKAKLILFEIMSLDPLRSIFWEHITSIVPTIIAIHGSPEAELQKESKRVLRVLSWACPLTSSSVFKDLFITALKSAKDATGLSSNCRKLSLEFMKLFYSRNFMIGTENARDFVTLLLPLLSDESTDVRSATSELLSTIFYSCDELSKEYSSIFDSLLVSNWATINSPNSVPLRHGAVLGASALILSCPYSIPSWMPSLLTSLTRYINDRYPIHETFRRVFSEFKRTHGDTWKEEREKFTESELDAINELLLAPSYYA